MPEPVEPPELTDNERAKWRAEFEKLGREAVRIAISRGHGLSPHRKRELALLWLREKEIETEDRASAENWYLKWTFLAAVVAAVAAVVGISLMLAGY
jgi:hypothetical protein